MSLLDSLIARTMDQGPVAGGARGADRITAICVDLASFGMCALILLGPVLGWI